MHAMHFSLADSLTQLYLCGLSYIHTCIHTPIWLSEYMKMYDKEAIFYKTRMQVCINLFAYTYIPKYAIKTESRNKEIRKM